MQESFKFCVALAKSHLEHQSAGRDERAKDWHAKERARARHTEEQRVSEQIQAEKLAKEKKRKQMKQPDGTDSDSEQTKEPERDKKAKTKDEKSVSSGITRNLAMSAVGLSALTLSLYSTYKSSSVLGEVSFHNQLELLLTHVEAILQSTQIWIQERESLGNVVPDVVRRDVSNIQEIVELIYR